MKAKWIIAVLGVVALAALTVTTQMPWLLHDETAMVESAPAMAAAGAPGEGSLSCPADAKPANLAFTLKDMHGQDVELSSFKGKVVLLDFWATWCRPCLDLMPHLSGLHQRYAARGLAIMALTRYGQAAAGAQQVEARASERELVRTVIAGRGLDDIRVGIAPDARLQRRYGAMGVPTLVLIDRSGLVRLIASGGDEAALESAIEVCLQEQEPPTTAPSPCAGGGFGFLGL